MEERTSYGVAQDLTAAGVVEEDLLLLQSGEVRLDSWDVQLAVNNDVRHGPKSKGSLRDIISDKYRW